MNRHCGSFDHPQRQPGCDCAKDETARRLPDQDAGSAQEIAAQQHKRDRAKRVAAPVDPGGIEWVAEIVEGGI